MELVLASGSPRRRELLSQLGLHFTPVNYQVDETITNCSLTPEKIVQELSIRKAKAAQQDFTDALIIGADTIVFDGISILGKPKDQHEAIQMLTQLQGKEHQVYTGITLIELVDGVVKECKSGVRMTRVWMRTLLKSEIEEYVLTGEPMDKAGSYGIQGIGATLIDRIDGCYFNVVGLSLVLLQDLFRQIDKSMNQFR
ncbi:septum formation protein [Seinonella peptonophila]|uniref:dTTP/UTP pyrophosphatase n=1 Tax=Seinonella peptonophila TaxID=112248 RepID=A0A1M4TTQ6_9BACL|nr:Maf family protein [Seinonella peptonophila]SHE47861.1 septum formation protein [Seinonella peptonophila]